MSGREKVLAAVVLGSVFLLLNVVLIRTVIGKQRALRQQLATRQGELKTMQILLSERDLWTQREAWLAEKQPKLANESTAGVQLLEQTRELAKAHGLTVENPAFGTTARNAWYRSVTVNVETKSTWAALIEFLGAAQQPEQFLVFESVNIAIDSSDPSQMRGKFRIGRWYAP